MEAQWYIHQAVAWTTGESKMIWLVLGLVLGYVIGAETKHKNPIDYSRLDQKLREDLVIAQNLNKSLLDDKHQLQEQVWKLKNAG